MKYCMNCKHFARGDCAKASKEYEDVVWGRETYCFKARDTRRDESKCGRDARWFEPYEPIWAKTKRWLS